jgi:hypothetical protein
MQASTPDILSQTASTTVALNVGSQDAVPPLKAQSSACPTPPADQAEPTKSPWEICLDYAKKHVNGETAVWKDEVDKLLIFVCRVL